MDSILRAPIRMVQVLPLFAGLNCGIALAAEEDGNGLGSATTVVSQRSPYARVTDAAEEVISAMGVTGDMESSKTRGTGESQRSRVTASTDRLEGVLDEVGSQAAHLDGLGRPIVAIIEKAGLMGPSSGASSAFVDDCFDALTSQIVKAHRLQLELTGNEDEEAKEMLLSVVTLARLCVATLEWIVLLEPGYDSASLSGMTDAGATLFAIKDVFDTAGMQDPCLDVALVAIERGFDPVNAIRFSLGKQYLSDPTRNPTAAPRIVWALDDGARYHTNRWVSGELTILASDVIREAKKAGSPTEYDEIEILLVAIGKPEEAIDGADPGHASEAAQRLFQWPSRDTYGGLVAGADDTRFEQVLGAIQARRDIPEAVGAGLALALHFRAHHEYEKAHASARHAIEAAAAQPQAMKLMRSTWYISALPYLARTSLLLQGTGGPELDPELALVMVLNEDWQGYLNGESLSGVRFVPEGYTYSDDEGDQPPPSSDPWRGAFIGFGPQVGIPSYLTPMLGMAGTVSWSAGWIGVVGNGGIGSSGVSLGGERRNFSFRSLGMQVVGWPVRTQTMRFGVSLGVGYRQRAASIDELTIEEGASVSTLGVILARNIGNVNLSLHPEGGIVKQSSGSPGFFGGVSLQTNFMVWSPQQRKQ